MKTGPNRKQAVVKGTLITSPFFVKMTLRPDRINPMPNHIIQKVILRYAVSVSPAAMLAKMKECDIGNSLPN